MSRPGPRACRATMPFAGHRSCAEWFRAAPEEHNVAMTHQDLVEALGGPHALQAKLAMRGVKVTQVAVRAWVMKANPPRFIPAKYWTHMLALAQAEGVPCTLSDLAQAVAAKAPPRKAKKASVRQSAAA